MRSFLAAIFFDDRYQKLKFYSALVLYLTVLVVGSIPGARADVGELATGVVLHGLTYGFIAFLLFGGVRGSAVLRALKAFLSVMAMGASDEWVQSFFPYRHADVKDWYVDMIAAFLTVTLLTIVWTRRNSKHP